MTIRVSGYQKLGLKDIWISEYQANGVKTGDFFTTEDTEGMEFSEQ